MEMQATSVRREWPPIMWSELEIELDAVAASGAGFQEGAGSGDGPAALLRKSGQVGPYGGGIEFAHLLYAPTCVAVGLVGIAGKGLDRVAYIQRTELQEAICGAGNLDGLCGGFAEQVGGARVDLYAYIAIRLAVVDGISVPAHRVSSLC